VHKLQFFSSYRFDLKSLDEKCSNKLSYIANLLRATAKTSNYDSKIAAEL